MPTCTINGQEIEVDRGTTVLQAAAELGFDVPHFCYHPALSIPANCRMCLVEVEKARKLLPACYTQVAEGMVVHTESERVVQARRAVLEFILVNHPVDCPICDQVCICGHALVCWLACVRAGWRARVRACGARARGRVRTRAACLARRRGGSGRRHT